jgi:Domain of unknown function (DUF4421)
MRKAKLIILILLPLVGNLYAQEAELKEKSGNGIGSSIIDPNLHHYSLRLYESFKDRSFILRNDNDQIRYKPNNRKGFGIGFANSKISLGMGISSDKDEHVTDRFEFSVNLTLKRKHIVGIFFQHYKGYNVVANEDHEAIFRDDISSLSGTISYLRLFNSEKLSLTSVMNGITRQTENAYSIAFGGAMTYKRTNADSSMVAIPGNDDFNSRAQITNLKEYGLSIIGQVNTIFVLPFNFFLTSSLVPGVGLNFQDAITETGEYNPKEPFTFTLGISAAIGWNLKRFYSTFRYDGIYNTGSLGYGNYTDLKVNKWKFVIGYKLFKEKGVTKN